MMSNIRDGEGWRRSLSRRYWICLAPVDAENHQPLKGKRKGKGTRRVFTSPM